MRRGKAKIRVIAPDVVYDRSDFSRFINYLMNKGRKGGKKSIAENIFYNALNIIKDKTKKDPVEIVDLAFKNVEPVMEVRTQRVGGANYQVPRPVREERKSSLTFRWIITAAHSKKGKSMTERLADELILASKGEGAAVEKKNTTHKIAEANRAFAHFAK
jgi:small subunit ribosomal protein S7